MEDFIKEQKRRERLALHVESIVNQIELMERFGIAEASLEACETIAASMAELSEMMCAVEQSKDMELRKRFDGYIQKNGRIWSGHFVAIRDMMRLCKMARELVELKKDLEQDSEVDWKNIHSPLSTGN